MIHLSIYEEFRWLDRDTLQRRKRATTFRCGIVEVEILDTSGFTEWETIK